MSRALERPSAARIPEPLRSAVRGIAERLARAGERAWIVGGAVRDLALGRTPKDADLASAARPEEVERLFEHTIAVGKHFGTVVVQHAGVDVQVTTFRSEGAYSDRRRPDEVAFGESLEEDARRRDFTCNALYLDPLEDEFRDPVGGLDDLAAGRLRCVGDPARRFAEDGLRLLRLARFSAALELEIEPTTLAAARENAARLSGVSPERIRMELSAIAAGPAPARALGHLEEIGVLGRILPLSPGEIPETLRAVERLGDSPGLALLLGVLLGPLADGERARALAAAAGLKPSRELNRALEGIWRLGAELERLLRAGNQASRAARIRLVREKDWESALRAHRSRFPDARGWERERERLAVFGRSLSREERFPSPWIVSEDLARAGVPRGPRWGEILAEAEERRLEGTHASREDALRWLRERIERGWPT